MEPQNLRFGGGVSETFFNPAVAAVVILAVVLMCILPQRKVIVPFLLTSLLIPSDQILVIAGLHFPLLRILIFFGMVRIFVIKGSGKWNVFSGGFNAIDKLMILLSVTSAVAGVLLFQDSQAFIFQLGVLYTAFGSYFLLRCLIRDQEDVVRAIRVLALIVVVLGGVMAFEHLTHGWNPYALLAGARASYFASDLSRDGHVRATATFGTPILAGTFGAVLLPVFIGLWMSDRRQRSAALLGILGATTMTAASHSSTPAFAYMAGIVGLCLWPIRGMMRVVRWGIVITLVSLQMVMKAPVYHLITRIHISGDSYHRYALIHESVLHFWDWWLIGTKSTAAWGWDMWDTADQYVSTAINGGLLGLIFLIAILAYGFKYLGRARKAAPDKKQGLFFWALGSALFATALSFLGISLWDQSVVGWYALLAFIAAVAVPQEAPVAVQQFRAASDPGLAAVAANPARAARWARPSIARERVRASLPGSSNER
ncbi:MAG TPA: hypothetical protein VGR97_09040 [Candidatus Acidoferrales bacterium]|nr:hypothetical protein [Candidatus Acidoferrales bacterium]